MGRVLAVLALAGALWLAPAAQAAPRPAPARSCSPQPVPAGPTRPRSPATGMLGVRVPPSGQGYAAGTVPAQSELAGFYAKVAGSPKPADNVQQRANIPTWSTLTFSDGGQTFAGTGRRASRTGASRSTCTPASSPPRRAGPRPTATSPTSAYQVLTDRAGQYVGLVRLQFTPHWTGTATVTDAIDGTARHDRAARAHRGRCRKGWDAGEPQDWVTVQARGTGIQATLASQLGVSPNVAGHAHADRSDDRPERRPAARRSR